MSQGKSGGSSTGTSSSGSNSFENELMDFLFGTPSNQSTSSMPSYSQPQQQVYNQPQQNPISQTTQGIGNTIAQGVSNIFGGTSQPAAQPAAQPTYTAPAAQPTYTAPAAQPTYATSAPRTAAPASSSGFAPGSLASQLVGSTGTTMSKSLFGGPNSATQFTTPPSTEQMGPTNAELGYNPVDLTSGSITDTSGNNLDLNTLGLGGGGDFTGSGDFNIQPIEPTFDTSQFDFSSDFGGDFGGDW